MHPTINRDNFIAYNGLQWEYNKSFRHKYRIKSYHFQLLSTIYYLDLHPPQGAVKRRLKLLNPLHQTDFIDTMLEQLKAKGMIQYDRGKNMRIYTIHLLSHVTKDMDKLYDLDNVEGYIQSKLSKY